jgi:hypothetical protein
MQLGTSIVDFLNTDLSSVFNSINERFAAKRRSALIAEIAMSPDTDFTTRFKRSQNIEALIGQYGEDQDGRIQRFLLGLARSVAEKDGYMEGRSMLEEISAKAARVSVTEYSSSLESLQYQCARLWRDFVNTEFATGGKPNEELAGTAVSLAVNSPSRRMREVAGIVLMQVVEPRKGLAFEVDNCSRGHFSLPQRSCG